MKIEVIHHATIKLIEDKIIYFDPYDIKKEYHDADYIFITHDHYDHYDEESIKKIKKESTKIIVPECLKDKENYLVVKPNNSYIIDNITIDVVPSYNIGKPFHPKEKEYVGYNILLNNNKYYVMGDTDNIEEINNIKTDYCFVPIGGTYTMDMEEAAKYINKIKPKVVIPIHYGKIVGEISLGEEFKNKINNNIEVQIMIKEN